MGRRGWCPAPHPPIVGYVSRLATTKAVVSTVMITISRAVSGHPAKAARMVRLISFIVVTVRLTSFLGSWRAEMVPSAELRHAVGWAFLLVMPGPENVSMKRLPSW